MPLSAKAHFPESLFPYLARAASKAGVPLRPLMEQAGIGFCRDTDLGGSPHRLRGQTMASFLLTARQAHPRHRMLIELAEAFRFELVQEVDAFLLTCVSLRDALQILPLLPQLVHPELRITLFSDDNTRQAGLDIRVVDIEPESAAIEMELLVALCAWTVLKRLMGDQLPPAHLRIRSNDIDWLLPYAREHDITVVADCDRVQIGGPPHILDTPLPNGYASLNARSWLEIQQRLRDDVDLKDRILHHWDMGRTAERFLLNDTATALDMTPRTLQRKLDALELRFQTLLDDYRLNQAQRLLKDPAMDIESIAAVLGFEDRRGFTIAFKRLAGLTPRAWRQLNAA